MSLLSGSCPQRTGTVLTTTEIAVRGIPHTPASRQGSRASLQKAAPWASKGSPSSLPTRPLHQRLSRRCRGLPKAALGQQHPTSDPSHKIPFSHLHGSKQLDRHLPCHQVTGDLALVASLPFPGSHGTPDLPAWAEYDHIRGDGENPRITCVAFGWPLSRRMPQFIYSSGKGGQ